MSGDRKKVVHMGRKVLWQCYLILQVIHVLVCHCGHKSHGRIAVRTREQRTRRLSMITVSPDSRTSHSCGPAVRSRSHRCRHGPRPGFVPHRLHTYSAQPCSQPWPYVLSQIKRPPPVRIGQNAGAQRFGENQNIALLDGIIAQDAVGWTTPETHSPYLGMSSLMVWPPTTMASASATLS